ncbi:hypothetical protein FBU31_000202 [Coemansia sp. 'formosensis']|nr:hypothetical protein FBU31_000202 [Coemansia sp. 'formosensis']
MTRDKLGDAKYMYREWLDSAIDYLKTQGHDIPREYISKPVTIRSKYYLVYGKGVYHFGEEDDYFEDDTELVVLDMVRGIWSMLTNKHHLAQYREYLVKSHLRIRGRPCHVCSCMVCGHVIPKMFGSCTENCPCCPPYVPKAPAPLEDE